MTEDLQTILEATSPETLAEVEQQIQEQLKPVKLNRAQRRALMKKGGKTGRQQLGAIQETTQKLNYIDLIQRLRELNEKRENEENETINEDG